MTTWISFAHFPETNCSLAALLSNLYELYYSLLLSNLEIGIFFLLGKWFQVH